MTPPSEDERKGGRLTFFFFVLEGAAWFFGSVVTVGEVNVVAAAGMAVAIVIGGAIGMMIGCYNIGRERGK